MAIERASNCARGMIFGAALTASGVAIPDIINQQFALTEFHMLKVFLTASASSAFLYTIFSSKPGLHPRPPSSFGWRWQYEGNVIGGVMIGLGMTLSGACPGTVFVQLITQVMSAVPTLLGAMAGGILYVKFAEVLRERQVHVSARAVPPDELTIPSITKTDPQVAIVAYEALLASVLISLNHVQSSPTYLLSPFVGGLLIGAAQLASIVLTGNPLGVSKVYEEFGSWFWWLVANVKGQTRLPKPSTASIQFALSVALGTYLLVLFRPELTTRGSTATSNIMSFAGGFVMAFGSRLAGGCTSGHGISGMSNLALSSIYTVASMFAGGIAAAKILYR